MKKLKLTEANLIKLIENVITNRTSLVETTDCKSIARDGFTACDKHTKNKEDKAEALKNYKACVQEVFKDYDTCKKKVVTEDAYDRDVTGDYDKRQDALIPGKNPDAFYGEDSIMNQIKRRGKTKEYLITMVKQIQKLLREDAPAIAYRRTEELLEILESSGSILDESKQALKEQDDTSCEGTSVCKKMLFHFKNVNESMYNMEKRLTGLIKGSDMKKIYKQQAK